MKFDHVISPAIRNVLYGNTEKQSDILQASYLTEAAMCEDWKSEFVSFETMQSRESFVEIMENCILAGNISGAIDAMRGFWSI